MRAQIGLIKMILEILVSSNGRLRWIKNKIIFSLLLIYSISLCILLSFFFLLKSRSHFSNRRQQRASNYMCNMKKFIVHTKDKNSYEKGNLSNKAKRKKKGIETYKFIYDVTIKYCSLQ